LLTAPARPHFFIRGAHPTLATGIFVADLDSGESSLLVEPENGYTLILPVWSPDGRFLSFDELIYMEGRGTFAYYDLEAQEYIAWDGPLGVYDWSPDGEQLVYDRLTYTATGEERIYTRPRLDGAEQQVSPEIEGSYAFHPVYSPDGAQIAYLTNPGGPDGVQHTLVVQDLATGETRQLGTYEMVWYLEWSSDGRALVFMAGPHLSQQVYAYDLVNGTSTVLVLGTQPSVALP
jgi:Tol biopolymer transport system component